MKGYWVKQSDGRWFNPMRNEHRDDPVREDGPKIEPLLLSNSESDFVTACQQYDEMSDRILASLMVPMPPAKTFRDEQAERALSEWWASPLFKKWFLKFGGKLPEVTI